MKFFLIFILMMLHVRSIDLVASLVCQTLKDELQTWQEKLKTDNKNDIVKQVRSAIEEQLSQAQKNFNQFKGQEQEIKDKLQEMKKEIDSLENQKNALNPSAIPSSVKFNPADLPKLRAEKQKLINTYQYLLKNPKELKKVQATGDQVSEAKIKELQSDLALPDKQLLEKAQKELEYQYKQIQANKVGEIDNKIKKMQQDYQSNEQALKTLPEKNKQDLAHAQSEIDQLQKRLNRTDDEIFNEQKGFAQSQIKTVEQDIQTKCK